MMPTAPTSAESLTPLDSASGRTVSSAPSMAAATSTAATSRRSFPPTMRDTSRTSSMIRVWARALRSMIPSARSSSAGACRRATTVHPRMALSGVRSSCDTVARKSSFARFATSASARAARSLSSRRARSRAALSAASPARLHLVGHVDPRATEHGLDLADLPAHGLNGEVEEPSLSLLVRAEGADHRVFARSDRLPGRLHPFEHRDDFRRRAEIGGPPADDVLIAEESTVRQVRELARELRAPDDRDDGGDRHQHRVKAVESETLRHCPRCALGHGAEQASLDVGDVVALRRADLRDADDVPIVHEGNAEEAPRAGVFRGRIREKQRLSSSRRWRPRSCSRSRWCGRCERSIELTTSMRGRAARRPREGESRPSRRCRPRRERCRGACSGARRDRPLRGRRSRCARRRPGVVSPRRARVFGPPRRDGAALRVAGIDRRRPSPARARCRRRTAS